MKRPLWMALTALCLSAGAETVTVPAGETFKVEPGRRFADGVLVKEGEGVLDLTGAKLPDAGLDIRAGAVRFVAGRAQPVTTRYVRFHVRKTRPGRKGPPEYANSGPQFSELRLYRDGKLLPLPAGATTMPPGDKLREGPQKAIDGNLKTKFYGSGPLAVDLGEEVTFDAYSFATGNDAIGRDPCSWTFEVGSMGPAGICWSCADDVAHFLPPVARCADIGRTFPVAVKDVVPFGVPVAVGGKARLVLVGCHETLENCSGDGLVLLEDATVEFGAKATFAGSVAGSGSASWRQ